jgi:uncharacterized protein YbbC (DUF1343 family)
MDGEKLAAYLNLQRIGGVQFRPLSYRPFYFDTAGSRFLGVQIHVTERENLDMTGVQISILDALQRLFPRKDIFERAKPDRIESFDKASGSSELRKALQSRKPVQEILKSISAGCANFNAKREKYLLYE